MGDVIYAPLISGMTWSFSRIKQFESCPYAWYLKYICELTPDREQFFSSYGLFMHSLLEQGFSGKSDRDRLVLRYLLGFNNHVHGLAPNSKVFANYFIDGLAYLRNMTLPAFRVLATEQKVRYQIGNIRMLGFIDLLGQDETGLILLDHKSRSLKERSGRKKPTLGDRELDEYMKQLYLYAAAVKQARGVFPTQLCFNCFRKNLLIKERFDEQIYHQTEQWLTDMVQKITYTTDFPPNWEYFKCNYLCDMSGHCEYHEMNSR